MLSFHTWKTYNLSSSNLNDMLPMFSRSVTRLGALLHFGQLFKAYGNNYFTQIIHMFIQFLKGFKNFHFSSEIIFGNFYRHWATFYWSHWSQLGNSSFRQVVKWPPHQRLSPPSTTNKDNHFN